MYDLLPLQRPEWFSDKLVVRYRKWLSLLAALADGFYCISPHVEAELREALARLYGLNHGFHTHLLPMGWDLASSRPSTGVPNGFDGFLARLAERPTALIVGTLEPRKGHADVLAAFDVLWNKGGNYNLVIAGRPGWKTEALQATLRSHQQYGEQLFWLEDASDEALMMLYGVCDGVIVASLAEGFGLPLIEALGHGKPVLARDIPVFRQHEAKCLHYFETCAHSETLAQTIREWFATVQGGRAPVSVEISSWADAARSIFTHLTLRVT